MADEEDMEGDPPFPESGNMEETAVVESPTVSKTDTIRSTTETTNADGISATEIRRSGQTSGPIAKQSSQISSPAKQSSQISSPVKQSSQISSSVKQGSQIGSPVKQGSQIGSPVKQGSQIGSPVKQGSQIGSPVKQSSQISPSVRSSQKSTPSTQIGKELEDALEKLSKSQEGSKKSELQLNGKKASLDQLAKDKSSEIQKSRAARLHRQCQRGFRELIGKRELKNEELEKQQGDLRQRLNILECSMPAVMVWNIWRMTQSGCVPSLQRVLEKQFQGPASGEIYCPSTPSRHFDCRVREVEAERKQAQKRVEEARSLWVEKMAALEEREKKLEEAKKFQEETKERIQQLTAEAQKLREAASTVEDDGSCETGECGVIECKKIWLEKVPSSASIKSTDLECLEKLQELAETELCMKRQIADLERREEAYMRTLQQADELWSKIEGDAASTVSALQEQLEMKTSANQQMADRICQLEDELEKMRARLVTCRGELEKFMSIEKIEALIGSDDDYAQVMDQMSEAGVSMRHKKIGEEGDLAGVHDKDMLARPDLADVGLKVEPYTDDKGSLIKTEMFEKIMLAGPDVDHVMLGISPEEFAREQQKLDEARDYLARLGSLSALDADDDYICPPDFACNDQVFTDTGLTEEEMTALKEKRVTPKMLLDAMTAGEKQVTRASEATEPITAVKTEHVEVKVEKMEVEETTKTVSEDVVIVEAEPPELVDIASKEAIEFRKETEARSYIEEQSPVEIGKEEAIIERSTEEEEMGEVPVMESESVKEVASRVPSAVDTPSRVAVDDTDKAPDADNIFVPRNEMLMWKDTVDSIRETIAKCPECVVVKGDADNVAAGMAQYTDTELKEVIEDFVPREEKVEVATEVIPEKPADIEVTAVPEERFEPEIEEAEIAAPAVIEEEEEEEPLVAEVVTKEEPTIELPEVEEVEEKAEPPTVPAAEEPEEIHEEIVPEAGGEPDEVRISEEAVAERIPEEVPKEAEELPVSGVAEEPAVPEEVEIEEKPRLIEEEEARTEEIAEEETVPREAREVSEVKEVQEVRETMAEEAMEAEAAVLPADTVEPEVIEAALPPKEEVEVEVEVLPTGEEEAEVTEVVLPPEEERVIEAEVIREEKEEEEPPRRDEVEIEADVRKETLPPAEAEVEAEAPPGEIEVDIAEEVPEPGKEEVEVTEAITEEGETVVEVEVSPEEKAEVSEAVLEEAEIEVDVEVLPEREEAEVTEAVPEEREIKVDVEVLPVVEEVEVTEAVPEEEEMEVDLEVIPQEGEEEVPLPAEEGVEVDAEVLPVEEEIAVEEAERAPEEEEAEIEVEVEVEEEEIAEVPEEEKEVEVDVEVLPEVIEEPVLPETEGVVPIAEEVEEVPEEVIPELLEEPAPSVEVPEVPEVPTVPEVSRVLPADMFVVPSDEDFAPCVCSMADVLPEPAKKIPSDEDSASCKCTTDVPSEPLKKIPSDKDYRPCTCTTDVPSEPPKKIPSDKDYRPCTCMADIPSEPPKKIPSDKDYRACTCMADVSSEPSRKIEITQTDITQMEITKISTTQVITQTVNDAGIQTLPAQRIRRVSQPKYMTITRPMDPEPEILERLARWKRSSKERSTVTTMTIGSQTEKFSFTQIHESKIGVEHELRSIHYAGKVEQSQQVGCNCCICGKTVSSSGLGSKACVEGQEPILRLLSALPMLSKLGASSVDQGVQHEAFCPECKMRRLQEALKTQDPPKQPKQVPKKPMRDQEIDACTNSSSRRSSSSRVKQKTDQCCMVKISKLKIERTLKKESTVCTVETICKERDEQKTVTSQKGEDEDSVECVCSATIETGKPGVFKKVRCACGDPH